MHKNGDLDGRGEKGVDPVILGAMEEVILVITVGLVKRVGDLVTGTGTAAFLNSTISIISILQIILETNARNC